MLPIRSICPPEYYMDEFNLDCYPCSDHCKSNKPWMKDNCKKSCPDVYGKLYGETTPTLTLPKPHSSSLIHLYVGLPVALMAISIVIIITAVVKRKMARVPQKEQGEQIELREVSHGQFQIGSISNTTTLLQQLSGQDNSLRSSQRSGSIRGDGNTSLPQQSSISNQASAAQYILLAHGSTVPIQINSAKDTLTQANSAEDRLLPGPIQESCA